MNPPFQPFQEALDFARSKQPLPTSLTSAQIARLSADLKRRAVFSARVDDAGLLQKLQDLLTPMAGGVVDEHGRLVSIPEAKAQLREYLRSIGYRPSGEDEGTLKDLLSDARRQLQVETNLLDTLGYGRWLRGQDRDELDVNPGWELVRMTPARVPRDWQTRWADAGGELVEGRMVALKNDPIWQALGDGVGGYEDTLGNPWPPFAFNSGMNVLDVPRDECVALGLIGETEEIAPEDAGLNDHLEASAAGFDDALRATLEQFPGLEIRGGALRLRNSAALRPGMAARPRSVSGLRNRLREILLLANSNWQGQPRDSLGRWVDENGGGLSERHNIARGTRAVRRSLGQRADVQKAMYRKGLGQIDFPWGTPGETAKDYAHGYGISHILAKHGRADALKLPVVLAKGKIVPHESDELKRHVVHGNYEATVVKDAASKSWVLTGFTRRPR